jgi:nucleoside-diphosphate-sugar epimerase
MVYGTVYNGKAEIFENDLGYVDLANPETNVVQSVRMAECVAINFAKATNADIKITRSGIAYGVTSDKSDPLYNLFSSDNKDTVAVVTGAKNGTTNNGYCYVTDCAKGILTALLKGKSGEIYNISSPDSVASNNELSEIIAKNMKNSGGMKLEKSTVSPMAPTQNVLNCSKIQELGFKAKVDLELGYKRIATIVRNGN